MTKIEILIDKLNNDKYTAVTITDKNTNELICRNKTSESIIDEFGTAENFFNSFIEKNQTNLFIEPKRKNGNNFKPSDENFSISPEVQEIKTNEVQTQTENLVKKKKKNKNKMFGLGAGLSAPEIISLNVKASQVDDLRERNRDLVSENTRLKEKNEELKIEQLEKKYTKENNDSRNALMLQGLQSLPMLAGAFGLKMPQTGLNATEENTLTEVQKSILDKVKATIEPVNIIFLKIMSKLETSKEGEPFYDEFIELLTKHQII